VQLTNGSGSGALNFNGQLQALSHFNASFRFKWSGQASEAIFFYFGGAVPPVDEYDSESRDSYQISNACILSFVISSGTFKSSILFSMVDKATSPPLFAVSAGEISLPENQWVPVEIEFAQVSPSSFVVRIHASGALVMTRLVMDCANWMARPDRNNWGVGAKGGVFKISTLEVTTKEGMIIRLNNF
jgi:hypothetical protein